ncbi:MAG: type II CRISPR RNA-guided endonuclease Cas9 [candidate division Zixibacteria bacterium]|nr:type II CRISPR RNA-guided endonuclease Cas9 [candidate division Zixibacteria bacterium]
METESAGKRILGIDLGPNSLGWTIIKKSPTGGNIEAIGVRAFEAGLDSLETDGKGKSRNAERREARSTRRRLERLGRRLSRTGNTLARTGLLPPSSYGDSDKRQQVFEELDKTIAEPYTLRAKALDDRLEPFELGRAFYHIAQRRGFLSNRKSPVKSSEDEGKVSQSIGRIRERMAETGSRTIGELFAKELADSKSVRRQYTARRMYEEEFDKIWESQRRFHADILTDDLKASLHRAIFYQRPLKSQKALVGFCALEPGRHRAATAMPIVQRFRYLKTVNNLKIINKVTGEIRALTPEERLSLLAELEVKAELSFAGVCRTLKLKRKDVEFNLEQGGEKRIVGNRTAHKLIEVFGLERWQSFTEDERDAIVGDLRAIVKDETLVNRAKSQWGLDDEAAHRLAAVKLEQSYFGYSMKAIRRLLPRLEGGEPENTAIKAEYVGRWAKRGAAREALPPVRAHELPALRNPIVERALTEVRRVVNSILAQHGKPDFIRIELGRDLRQTAKQRETTWRRNRANEKDRAAAAQKIIEECGIVSPKRGDILRVLLANECNWRCPYTGKPISMSGLIGDHPQFDVEHIIPFDRCLDDSFMNVTLCDAEENRLVKKNRTPYEAYHGTAGWQEILNRLKDFQGSAARTKKKRFEMPPAEVKELLSEFTSRQLNDTRWAARWAKKYLGLLYGGLDDDGIDNSGVRRVQATSGAVTAFLRNEWGLNGILGDGPGKSRDDHRHHAVDAIAVALTEPGMIKALSDAAHGAKARGRRLFGDVTAPWEGFLKQANQRVKDIVTSHMANRRVRGALHKATFYGKPHVDEKGKPCVHIRVPLDSLSAKDVANIVDPAIRQIVQQQLTSRDGDPRNAFKSEGDLPLVERGDGSRVRIRRVRIRQTLATFEVGGGSGVRHVQSETNHHMEVVAVVDEAGGDTRWDGYVVSLLEAYTRVRNGKPIVNRDFGPGRRFVFSVGNADILELDDPPSGRSLFRVRTVSDRLLFFRVNDARKKDAVLKQDTFAGLTANAETLRKRHCRKVSVTPLGIVRWSND